jgi:mRNA interferase MazF
MVPNELRRGDVVRVRLDPTEGSEQAGERPALILSPDLINAHSPVVVIAAITSKRTDRVFAFEALLEPPEGGLSLRSKVMLMQLRSVNKTRLLGYYGHIGESAMQQVDQALKVAVGL